MQRGPTVAGEVVNRLRVFVQRFPEGICAAGGCRFEEVERQACLGSLAEEEVSDHRLAGVNGPEQSGNALGIAPGENRRIAGHGFGYLGRGSALDQFQKLLAHEFYERLALSDTIRPRLDGLFGFSARGSWKRGSL